MWRVGRRHTAAQNTGTDTANGTGSCCVERPHNFPCASRESVTPPVTANDHHQPASVGCRQRTTIVITIIFSSSSSRHHHWSAENRRGQSDRPLQLQATNHAAITIITTIIIIITIITITITITM